MKRRITTVEKTLEVGVTVAEPWPHIKPVLCSGTAEFSS
jgi:hypothetical protein